MSGASFESTGIGWIGLDEVCEVDIRSEAVTIFRFDMLKGPFIPITGDSAISSAVCGSMVRVATVEDGGFETISIVEAESCAAVAFATRICFAGVAMLLTCAEVWSVAYEACAWAGCCGFAQGFCSRNCASAVEPSTFATVKRAFLSGKGIDIF